MLRRLWIVIALGLSLVAGYAGHSLSPAVVEWSSGQLGAAPPARFFGVDEYVPVAVALTSMAVSAFVLVFLGLAMVDGLQTAVVVARLGRLAQARRQGKGLEVEAFSRAFGSTHLAAPAAAYAATLVSGPGLDGYGEPQSLRATVSPGRFFAEPVLVDGRLLAGLFRYFPTLLWSLGLTILAASLLSALARFRDHSGAVANADGVPYDLLFSGAEVGLMGMIVPAAVAPIVGLLLRGVLEARYRQVRGLRQKVGALFQAHTVGVDVTLALEAAVRDLEAELQQTARRLADAIRLHAEKIGARTLVSAPGPVPIPFGSPRASLQVDEPVRRSLKVLKRGAAAFLSELEKRGGERPSEAPGIQWPAAPGASDVPETLGERTSTERQASAADTSPADPHEASEGPHAEASAVPGHREDGGDVVRESEETAESDARLADGTGRGGDVAGKASLDSGAYPMSDAAPNASAKSELARAIRALRKDAELITRNLPELHDAQSSDE